MAPLKALRTVTQFRMWPLLMLHPMPCDLAFCEMFPNSLRGISSEARRNLLIALDTSVSSIVDKRMKMCGNGDEGGNGWMSKSRASSLREAWGHSSVPAKLCVCLLWWLPASSVWLPGLSSPGCYNLSWPQNSRQRDYILSFPLTDINKCFNPTYSINVY